MRRISLSIIAALSSMSMYVSETGQCGCDACTGRSNPMDKKSQVDEKDKKKKKEEDSEN